MNADVSAHADASTDGNSTAVSTPPARPALPELPKAFAVWFEDLERWSVRSFLSASWQWPNQHIRPLAEALERKRERVDKTEHPFETLTLITLRFDGSMEARDTGSKSSFKGRLYFAEPGDVVYSKIDVRNGAIGLVPDDLGQVAVSSEFPVYTVRPEVATPRYIKLLFRTGAFRKLVNSMISGASGRKRVKPVQLENIEVPLPPLPVQKAIVAHDREAQEQVSRLRQEASSAEAGITEEVAEDAGLQPLNVEDTPKAFAVYWEDFFNWNGEGTHLLSQISDMEDAPFPIVGGTAYLESVRNGCSSGPSRKPTGLDVLKISAVTRGTLDTSERKHIKNDAQYRKKFDLREGDVLICRTNGTLDYVGMSALVREDKEDLIFPDKLIRLRPKKNEIIPAYLWRVLQTPHVRVQIEAAARTAVGNYAIGGQDVWDFRIPLPPLDVQRRIVADAREKRAEAKRLRAEAQRAEDAARGQTEHFLLGTRKPPEARQSAPSP